MGEQIHDADQVETGRMLGAMFRIPYQAIAEVVNRALVDAGFEDIRPSHQSVFQLLPPDGARISELAEKAQITKQSMGALVSHLEEGGYLERVPDPVDRRAARIRRTARGWAVEQAARESIARLEAEWAEELSPKRMKQLQALLADLVSIVEGDG